MKMYKINLEKVVEDAEFSEEDSVELVLENLDYLRFCVTNRDRIFYEDEFIQPRSDYLVHTESDWCFNLDHLVEIA